MKKQQTSFRGKVQHEKTLLARIIRQIRLVSTGALLAQSAIVIDVQASPTGGQVVGGSGAIQQSGTQTLIQQNTQNLAIDWQTFNLSGQDSVQFIQPSSSATALNRILDTNPSQIHGLITANGKVFLINASGIIFGKTAVVNVGSLVATSLDMSVNDFMDGRYDLSDLSGSEGVIVNRGLLEAAAGGSITLLGHSVSNEGVIVADYGHVNLAAGRKATLDFDGDGLIRFEITEDILENTSGQVDAVNNSGVIQANGGQVLLTASTARDVFTNVVNNEGVIRASRIDNTGGFVRLVGSGGTTLHSGDINVAGADDASTGGEVHILGNRVGLMGNASIDASGATGGGTVLVGGDYQGGNTSIKNAERTYMSADAKIDASATRNGDGGMVVVWSDDTTRYFGQINARGGMESGDGGMVEVSGKEHLGYYGVVDASAPKGNIGTLLLDPTNINVVAVDPLDGSFTSNLTTVDAFADPDVGTNLTSIDVASINSSLADVTLQATNNISFNTDVTMQTNVGLTADAGNDINLNANITASGTGSINLTADADTGGGADGVGAISGTGIVTAGSGIVSLSAGSGITASTNVTNLAVTNTTSGDVSITETDAINLVSANTSGNFSVSAGGDITDATGTTLSVAGLATLNAGANDITLGDDAGDTTNFGSLDVTGGAVTITEDSATVLAGVSASSLGLTSAGSITDGAGTTIAVTNLATLNAGANDITLGDDAGDTTNFGSLDVTGGAVTITEDSATVLAGVSASSLGLTSAGSITDGAGTTIAVTNLATLNAGANDITLGDDAGDTTNFGSLDVTGGAVTITEDSATVLAGVSASSLGLTSAGSITDGAGTTIAVTNLATLNAGANDITLGDDAGDTTNFGSLDVTGGVVTITEDSATVLAGVSASSLDLTSNGSITQTGALTVATTADFAVTAATSDILLAGADNNIGGAITVTESGAGTIRDLALRNINAAAAVPSLAGLSLRDLALEFTNAAVVLPTVTLAGDLSVLAGGSITDAAGTVLSVAGLATLNAGANDITLGDDAGDTTNFGSLDVTGGAVTITEDSATVLAGVSASSLGLTSAGSITDGAGTTIAVTNLATLNAGANDITLGDDAGDTTNFGSLDVTGGAVTITEDSATVLAGVSASSLGLTSAGSITDGAGTTIAVTNLATLNAGANDITLGDDAGDTTNFGSLDVTGGAVTITEDSATVLAGVSASSLGLTSAGSITDGAGTTIAVTNLATLNAGANDITLGDDAGDTTNFGSLDVTGGVVTITEDSATVLAGVSASSLDLTSNGSITQTGALTVATTADFAVTAATSDILLAGADNNIGGAITVTESGAGTIRDLALRNINAAAAVPSLAGLSLRDLALEFTNAAVVLPTVTLAGDLSVLAGGSITDAAGTVLSVAGLATLNAGANDITLGDDAGDTTNFGSLDVTGGAVTITEDSATVLAGVSASSLGLTSAGSITDGAGTTIAVTNLATLNAGANDITLGDDAGDTTNFGSLDVTGGAVTITEDSATVLAGVSASSLGLTSAGSITDGAGTTIAVTNLATLNAGANDITLGDDAGDTTNFGSLDVTGGAVTITEDSATVLAGVSASSLGLTSAGSITDGAGTTIAVTNLATLNAGANDITLGDDAGDTTNFGSLDVTGGVVTITEDSATVLAGVSASSLDLTSNGSITQTGALTVATTADFAVTAATSDILLAGADNNIGGAITVTESGAGTIRDLALRNINAAAAVPSLAGLSLRDLALEFTNAAVVLPTVTLARNLVVTSQGILQSGAVGVSGTSTLDAGANAITLTNAANDFTGAVSLTNSGANNVAVTDANAIDLGASSVGSGTLDVNAVGITQTGAITQAAGAGAATFDGGAAAIDLTNTGNDFTGAVSLNNSGVNTVALFDSNTLDLGSSTIGGDLTLTAGTSIFNSIVGLTNVSSTNAIITVNFIAVDQIGTSVNEVIVDVPDTGDINATFGAPVAYIDWLNSVKPINVIGGGVIAQRSLAANLNVVKQNSTTELKDLGYVDWSLFSEDLNLFGVVEPGIQMPADQVEDELVMKNPLPNVEFPLNTLFGWDLVSGFKKVSLHPAGGDETTGVPF